MNYASEVDLFDDEINPIFPDDDGHRAEKILQWLTDGIHEHGTIHISSLTSPLILENTAASRQTFAMINKHDLEWVNNRENSAVAEAYLRARGIPEEKAQYAKALRWHPFRPLSLTKKGHWGGHGCIL